MVSPSQQVVRHCYATVLERGGTAMHAVSNKEHAFVLQGRSKHHLLLFYHAAIATAAITALPSLSAVQPALYLPSAWGLPD